MSGIFYVWLVLLLLSYPFAYKYYGTLRKQSKKPMVKNKENATFCKQLKNVFKNKNVYGAGFFYCIFYGSYRLLAGIRMGKLLGFVFVV